MQESRGSGSGTEQGAAEGRGGGSRTEHRAAESRFVGSSLAYGAGEMASRTGKSRKSPRPGDEGYSGLPGPVREEDFHLPVRASLAHHVGDPKGVYPAGLKEIGRRS